MSKPEEDSDKLTNLAVVIILERKAASAGAVRISELTSMGSLRYYGSRSSDFGSLQYFLYQMRECESHPHGMYLICFGWSMQDSCLLSFGLQLDLSLVSEPY